MYTCPCHANIMSTHFMHDVYMCIHSDSIMCALHGYYHNEGTKVQNPRRLCHVYTYYTYTAIYMYIRGQMRECTGKYTEIWHRQKL